MPSTDIKALVQQDPLGLLTMLRDRMGRERDCLVRPDTGRLRQPDGAADWSSSRRRPFDTDFARRSSRLTAVEATARRDACKDPAPAGSRSGGRRIACLRGEQLIRREGIINSIGSLLLLMLSCSPSSARPVMLAGCLPLALAADAHAWHRGLIQGSLSPAIADPPACCSDSASTAWCCSMFATSKSVGLARRPTTVRHERHRVQRRLAQA
jgi:hypothetical protein